MAEIPEFGTPCEDSPEITERDFAFSRRRDGSLAQPKLYARYRLREIEHMLQGLNTDDSSRLLKALDGLREIEAALADPASKEAAE